MKIWDSVYVCMYVFRSLKISGRCFLCQSQFSSVVYLGSLSLSPQQIQRSSRACNNECAILTEILTLEGGQKSCRANIKKTKLSNKSEDFYFAIAQTQFPKQWAICSKSDKKMSILNQKSCLNYQF